MDDNRSVPDEVNSFRTPPYSEEAERSVLGSILLAPKLFRKVIKKGLEPDSFFVPANHIIFEAFVQLHNAGKPIDITVVSEYLKAEGQLSRIGDSVYLDGLIDDTPTQAHLMHYLDIVLAKHKRRRIIANARSAEAAAFTSTDHEDEILSKFKYDLHKIGVVSSVDESVNDIVARLIGTYRTAQKEGSVGIISRWFDVRQKIVGYIPRKITIVAGRPGQGKTTMVLNESLDKAIKGDGVLIISIEMTRDEIIEKLICDLMGLNSELFKSGRATTEDIAKFREGGEIIARLPIFIEDGNHTVPEICSLVREHREEHNITICVIDYIQIVSSTPGTKHTNRNAELSTMSNDLLHLGNETGVHFFIVSQLSRAISRDKKEEPQLHHLRDCGALEQDAYMVIFIYQDPECGDDYWEDNAPTIFKVAKQRGGREGRIRMTFNKKHSRFVGLDNQFLNALSALGNTEESEVVPF